MIFIEFQSKSSALALTMIKIIYIYFLKKANLFGLL